MSNVLRMLQMLPVYVVTGKTAADSTDAAGYIPIKDEGTRGPVIDATSGLPITQITDITGLVAWKDYIPVQEYTGGNPRWSSGGYIPCKLASGSIFVLPEVAATWDPATVVGSTLSNGNKTIYNGSTLGGARATKSWTNGKRYLEYYIDAPGTGGAEIGMATTAHTIGSSATGSSTTIVMQASGGIYVGGGAGAGSFSGGIVATNVLMVAINMDNGAVWIGRNGTWLSGNPSTLTSPLKTAASLAGVTLFPCMTMGWFGMRVTIRTTAAEFSYAVPTGFTSWGTT